MKTFEAIAYGSLPQHVLNIYLPDQKECNLLFWFHGGGLEHGTNAKPGITDDLIAAGIGVISVEYRMYPAAHFPDYLLDAAWAVRFIQDHIIEYCQPKNFYLSGSSAGAYITMMLTLNPAYLRNAGVKAGFFEGIISDSAQATTHYNVLRERGLDSRLERIDEAAPLYYVGPNLQLPRMLLISYEKDIVCRPEQNYLMFTALKRFYPDADIRYVLLPGTHTNGSSRRNEKGTYDYVDEALKFIPQ